MRVDEAKDLLGFQPTFHPSQSQIKAAYKKKAWEFHPDRFPLHEKYHAESKFKLISEAYTCLQVEDMAPTRSMGFIDPGWEHGVTQDGRKKKVKCNYCGKIVSGGIYRLKQHLARISGEVTYCNQAPESVILKMKENLEGCRTSKKQQISEDEEQDSFDLPSYYDFDEEEEPFGGFQHKGRQAAADKNLVVSLSPLRSLGFVDPGWEHGVAQDVRKKKVKCNYCDRIVSGGINRFKQHLARIPGEVAYCKRAPEEVYFKMKENMKWHRTGRRPRQREAKEVATFYMPYDNGEKEQKDEEFVTCGVKEKLVKGDKSLIPYGKSISKRLQGKVCGRDTNDIEHQLKKSRLDYGYAMSPNDQAQLSSYKQVKPNECSDKKAAREVMTGICEFFYHAAIPFNVTDSSYFHKMLDLVGQYGQGLKGPTSRMISGWFLHEEVKALKDYQSEFKASWAVTGCSIMVDSWKDVHGRTLINFLVSCSRGVYFVSSIDATDIVKDAPSLYRLFDEVVEEVGEGNVVQVITENTLSYKAAGKMLEEKRRKLFWTPCAAYCIDRMLEDFVKIKMVGECMKKCKKITKFIYNRPWLLNIMKKEFTGGRELVVPAISRFAASFLTLQSLIDHKNDLKKLFLSDKWVSSGFSKVDKGKEIEKIVLNSSLFWKKMQFVKKSVDPIIQVIQKVDSKGGLSMPTIYDDMHRAKLAIKTIHGNDARKYGPYLTVVDERWTSLSHHPLYVAAYFLNPSFRYRTEFLALPEVVRGLNECIVRLEPDTTRRIAASTQISEFVYAKADFGTELAISTRMELDPAAWWQQHGINCLELQRIAVRILSQTSSSFGCEHGWSIFDQIHIKRKNHLAQKKLNDLICVHYNLRLREHQLTKKPDESSAFDNVLLESLLDDWIIESEKPAFPEDEEILFSEMEHSEMEQTEANENEGNEIGDIDAEAQMEALEKGAFLVVEPLGVQIPVMVATNKEDDDFDFLDDESTDS